MTTTDVPVSLRGRVLLGENCFHRWVEIAPRHHALAMLRTSWTLYLRCPVLSLRGPGGGGCHPPIFIWRKGLRGQVSCVLSCVHSQMVVGPRLDPSHSTRPPDVEDRGGTRLGATTGARWEGTACAKALCSRP